MEPRRAPPADWDAVVVGAGITGLAAAHALGDRRQRVLVLDRAGVVGAEQSAGLGRIFRIAHGDAARCALALEAREGWRRWERELGAGRLLGDEGLVVAGQGAPARAAAMTAAGAPVRVLARAELDHHIPHLAPGHPWDAGVHDPLAGSLRIRRALRALAARLDVRRAEVAAVRDGDDRAEVELRDGSRVRAAVVLVCAGTATPALAATAGVALELHWRPHVRLTYAADGGGPLPPSACLITEQAYGLPLGSTGRWALGLEERPAPAQPPDTAAGDADAEAARRLHAEWVPRHLRGLQPEPVGEVRCVAPEAPWLDAHGDGVRAVRGRRVIACTGANLMKFGPVLGDRLARTALDRDDVHPDLLAS